ncbi:hypothetical protein DSECCO2_510460 [anaerobic digester metagenome]
MLLQLFHHDELHVETLVNAIAYELSDLAHILSHPCILNSIKSNVDLLFEDFFIEIGILLLEFDEFQIIAQ